MLIQSATASVPQAKLPVASPSNESGTPATGSGVSVVTKPSATPELPPQAATKTEANEQISSDQAKGIVENINRVLKQSNKNLEFSVDKETNRQVFKLKDVETGDVIRQYPTEEMLAISQAIDLFQEGLLLKQEA